MANVLVLKSSINGETSLTNQLINEFLAARQAAGHGDRLIEHDLSAMALPTLDRPLFAALRGAVDPQPAIREAVALSDQLIAELKASDLLVIGAPSTEPNCCRALAKRVRRPWKWAPRLAASPALAQRCSRCVINRIPHSASPTGLARTICRIRKALFIFAVWTRLAHA